MADSKRRSKGKDLTVEEIERTFAYYEALHNLAMRPRTCPLCRWSRDWHPDRSADDSHAGKCFYNPPTVVWTGNPPCLIFSTYPEVYRDSPACSKFELVDRINIKTGLLTLPAEKPKNRGGDDGRPVV